MRTWKKGVIRSFVLMLFLTVSLSGCSTTEESSSAETIEGLDSMGDITVVTREEGSGTRGVFAEKTNLENEDASSNADKITTEAKIAMDAEAVVNAVAADANAIGYLSLGAVSKDLQDVKVIAVNKIVPDQDTIGNGSYPLSRNFNIAYSGKLTNAGNDFLNYILSAGQEIVAQDYTSVKKTASFLSDQSTGNLKISGSTSAAPLLEALAADYNTNYNSHAVVEVQTSDSTSGLTAAMQGSSDWGMASRELKDYEKELLTYKTIAKDGVAVIVNAQNPTESLTIDQLTQIFDGTDQEWKDVNK